MPSEGDGGWAVSPGPVSTVPVSGGDGAVVGDVGVGAGIPVPPETGDETVDQLLDHLAAVQTGSLETRAEAFDETHQALQGLLDDVDRRTP